MRTIEENKGALSEFIVSLVAFTAAVTFTAQPLMKFANAAGLAFAGVVLGAGLSISYLCLIVDHRGKVWTLASILGGAGVTWLIALFVSASDDARANDKRCAVIQADMLSLKPRRQDGPDLFTALGCRPQGLEGVSLPDPMRPIGK